jgi:serine/threonine-protein kinase SRPK3
VITSLSIRRTAPTAAPISIIDFGQFFIRSDRPETLRNPLVLRPPEVLFEDKWNYRVDLWVMGCTVYILWIYLLFSVVIVS